MEVSKTTNLPAHLVVRSSSSAAVVIKTAGAYSIKWALPIENDIGSGSEKEGFGSDVSTVAVSVGVAHYGFRNADRPPKFLYRRKGAGKAG